MNNLFFGLAPSVALCLPLLAFAQVSRPDPADAKAPAPDLHYQSAFADYNPWQDTKLGDWRAVNDNVRDAAAKDGSHAGHTMPSAPPKADFAPAPKATEPAHGGQQMHGGKQ